MTFWSALMLGLIASAHCIGMCGGLQMALQTANGERGAVLRSSAQQFQYLLLLNLGRLFTYSIAGVLFSLLGAKALAALNIGQVSSLTRVFTGTVIFLLGLQIMFGSKRPFQFLEPLGLWLWSKVSALINHQKNRAYVAFSNGMAWGFLPCGLVYGVLFSTVLINQPLQAGLVMLGFGLGTVPGLVLTGTLFQRFKAVINQRLMQSAAALFFMLGGGLVLTAPYWVDKTFMRQYPELLNSVFCFS